jgi:hypothetical protein
MISFETYPIVIYGVPVTSMDMSTEGKEKTIKLLLYENRHWLFLDSRILYIGWLKKKKTKGYMSIVVDFLHPKDVNTSMDRGIT